MKNSPLQLGLISYSDVVVRAVPGIDIKDVNETLPVEVDSSIFYDSDGEHYATVTVRQKDETYPYSIEVAAFAMFKIDVDGCREAYKQQFNPAVLGVNVVRMIYSSIRETIASITARAPYETARIPNLIIEPNDIVLHFEEGKEDNILRNFFGLDDEQLEQIRRLKAELQVPAAKGRKKTSKKSSVKK